MRNALTEIKSMVESKPVEHRLRKVLGENTPAFVSSIVSSVSANPALMKCDPRTIVQSASVAAITRLPIVPGLGFSFLVPYKDQCTWQCGYKGFVQLGHRSKEYASMNATKIPAGVIKHHNPITGQFEFDLSKFDPAAPAVGYMFYSKLANGFERFHYMSKEECHDHGKRYSQSFKKNYGPWVENFDAMARKTVIKLDLSKWGQLSIDMQHAIRFDQGTPLAALDEPIEEGNVLYPDSPDAPVTPEASAERLAELEAARAELIPGLTPPQTPKQFFDEVMSTPGAGKLHVETMIKMLNEKGQTSHAMKLQALLEAAQ